MQFKCTFTGVDEQTSFDELMKLIVDYPFVEFGILFSYSKMGVEPRYPSLEFIRSFVEWYQSYMVAIGSISLHVCGQAVKDLLLLISKPSDERCADLKELITAFDRVQLNVNLSYPSNVFDEVADSIAWKLEDLGKQYQKPFILQYNENNTNMVDFLLNYNHFDPRYLHILKDASGGRGVYTEDFSIPVSCSKTPIGFAGGLGVDNVETALNRVHESVMSHNVEGHNDNKLFWIDMENKVRTDDRLDLGKVRAVCEIVNNIRKTW